MLVSIKEQLYIDLVEFLYDLTGPAFHDDYIDENGKKRCFRDCLACTAKDLMHDLYDARK